jgi:5-(carboxyamino)imidazole ribonucleotide synthase
VSGSEVVRSARPGSSSALPPLTWLGLLGGGQLGRMFTMAAQSLGYRVCVLDPDAESPTGAVADRHLCAAFDDPAALEELASLCSAVTTEFENVPADTLAWLATRCTVSPSARAVSIAQDRMAEKAFVRACGIATAPYAEIHGADDLDRCDDTLFPGILKTARLGYDGKGQFRVASRVEARDAYAGLRGVACVLEKQLDLACEVSVLIARTASGECAVWPVAQNVHRSGILFSSTIPAVIAPHLASQASDAAVRIANALDYVGVLCVEFFVLGDGSLCVNEMAPRPHNSGHWTLDASLTSQFEQQARVLAGLPLGDTRALAPAVLMLNLLGDLWFAPDQSARGPAVDFRPDPDTEARPIEPDWAAALAEPLAKLHLYGKTTPRRGRKMGHLTVVAESAAMAEAAAGRAARAIGLGASR